VLDCSFSSCAPSTSVARGLSLPLSASTLVLLLLPAQALYKTSPSSPTPLPLSFNHPSLARLSQCKPAICILLSSSCPSSQPPAQYISASISPRAGLTRLAHTFVTRDNSSCLALFLPYYFDKNFCTSSFC
jgi:hypothetical protein